MEFKNLEMSLSPFREYTAILFLFHVYSMFLLCFSYGLTLHRFPAFSCLLVTFLFSALSLDLRFLLLASYSIWLNASVCDKHHTQCNTTLL